MKKLFVFALTLFGAAMLSLSAFAAEDTVLSVSVEALAPVAGIHAEKAPIGETAMASVNKPEMELMADFDVLGFSWNEKDSGISLDPKEPFVSGRTYVLRVEIELLGGYTVTDGTVYTLGGKTAECQIKGTNGEKLTLSAEFVAVPEDFEPKVSLTVQGEKTKEFDGEGIEITALVDELGGIRYEYVWYRDMIVVEGASESSYTVRDVSQSGNYFCSVTAYVIDDPAAQPKTARTSSYRIEITPTLITLQIENAQKNLSDNDPRFSYTVLGNVCDPLYGSPQRVEGEDIGKYPILLGTLTFAEDKMQNYQIIVKQGVLTILEAGELPFSAVAEIADLSYISGAQKAKIRVSASKGAIPDGAILSLSTATDEAKSALEQAIGRSVMKAFTVAIVSKDGKELSLPKHGALRIQIPLTEEEMKLDLKTVGGGLYTKSAESVDAKVEETEGVSYILLEIKALGTVALFDGEEKASDNKNSAPSAKPEEKSRLWLWIVVAALSASAVCGIGFTVIYMVKNKKRAGAEASSAKKPKKSAAKKKEDCADPFAESLKPAPEEKKRNEAAAREMNEKAPVPEKEKPRKKSARTVISFEDLED